MNVTLCDLCKVYKHNCDYALIKYCNIYIGNGTKYSNSHVLKAERMLNINQIMLWLSFIYHVPFVGGYYCETSDSSSGSVKSNYRHIILDELMQDEAN